MPDEPEPDNFSIVNGLPAGCAPTLSDKGTLLFRCALFLVFALGCMLRFTPDLRRPFEYDEISSLNTFTTVGYISKLSELHQKRPLMFGETVKGLTRSFIMWVPANHVIYNLGVSICTFFLGFSEMSTRITALAGSLAFVVLMMLWTYRTCRSVFASVLLGLVALTHPYFVYYGETARGYSLTAALVMLEILFLDVARKQLINRWIMAAFVLLNYCIFLNLVSTLFIWLAPLCICSLFWRGKPASVQSQNRKQGLPASRIAQLSRWLFPAAILGMLVAYFVLEHVQGFMLTQDKYGLKSTTIHATIRQLGGIFQYLFPNYWIFVGLMGAGGLMLMLLRSDSYWLAPVALLSLLFCSAYAIASKTVPYPRTFGIWLVYALAGVAWVWRYSHLCGRLRGLACRIVISGIVILTLLESIAHPVSLAEKVNFGVLGLRVNELIRRTKATPNNTLVLLPFIFSEQMRFYLPDDDRFLSPATDNGSKLTVYIPCSKLENQNAFRCQYYDRAKAELVGFPLPATWNQFKVFDQAGYSLFAVPMSLSRNSANAATDPATAHIVVWTSKDPYFNLAKYVTDNVQKNTAPWNVHLLTSRTTTSSSVTFFTSGQEELRSVETILENLHERTAGETFFLTPGF